MKCPNCGRENARGKNFCTNCGQNLSDKRKYIIIGIVIFVVVCLFIVIKPNKEKDNHKNNNDTTISSPTLKEKDNTNTQVKNKAIQQTKVKPLSSQTKKDVKVHEDLQVQKNNVIEDFMY